MSVRADYIVALKNPRYITQIATLATQIYPGNTKFMVEAYWDATSQMYGYLLIDLKPQTAEQLRLRANIFADEVNYAYYQEGIKAINRHPCHSFKHEFSSS